MSNIWQQSLALLKANLSKEEIETWISPLQGVDSGDCLSVFAPNQFVLSYVKKNYQKIIVDTVSELSEARLAVEFKIGSHLASSNAQASNNPASSSTSLGLNGNLSDGATQSKIAQKSSAKSKNKSTPLPSDFKSNLNPEFVFSNHVQGKSNQLARAASSQVGENPGKEDYNPLFIYGGVGLGKTHLMQAAGNAIRVKNPNLKVYYIHSERFVAEYVKALQSGNINQFKQHYRSLDALLIDDIQFFAEKKGSQEEFFHTFNQLLELKSQIIITSDTIPKDLSGVEERLISRFSRGLAISVNPPELETRVAILNAKAEALNITLPDDVAFFIAKQVRSNVRELEGALNRVNADSKFTGVPIDLALAKDALRDILLFNERKITIDYVQKRVAEYYNIRVADLLSKKRNQPIARARQMAMKCTKELTSHSLPDIGDAYGGRDHTTVLHACRKIDELTKNDTKTSEDYSNLIRILGG